MAMLPSSTGDAIQGKRLPKWGSSCAFSEFQVGGTGAAGIAAAKELAVTQPPAIRAGQAAQVAGVVHAVQREAASAGGKRLVGRIRTGHGAGSLVFEACR
ncbi:hypothetical protein G6F24_017995 [Rhizopus arrhizus]|nr:hypothetical protein G6F24_017995 [Rhizopus arrhizus]